jgi:hypothetical protein
MSTKAGIWERNYHRPQSFLLALNRRNLDRTVVDGCTFVGIAPPFFFKTPVMSVALCPLTDVLVRLKLGPLTESVVVTAGEAVVNLSSSQLLGFRRKM